MLYNFLNLPQEIQFGSGSGKKILYTYNAAGVKLRKEVNDNGTIQEGTFNYVGNVVYDHNDQVAFISTGEGRLVPDPNGTYRYEYYLKDHLGNVRVSFTALIEGVPQVMQENAYYPFGMTIADKTYNGYDFMGSGTSNRYLSTAKNYSAMNLTTSVWSGMITAPECTILK
jgi:hypothetical protein